MDKIIVIVLNGNIATVQSYEGVTNITSELSSIFIDNYENLLLILNSIGITDLSKLEEFKENNDYTEIDEVN